MTLQEHYENWCVVNGEKLPSLSEKDKEIFALYEAARSNPNIQGILISHGRRCPHRILKYLSEKLKEDYKKLPAFLTT